MNIFTVSFFGRRQIDNPLQVESQLEEIICSLLKREEYIEFLVGRDGEFDQIARLIPEMMNERKKHGND